MLKVNYRLWLLLAFFQAQGAHALSPEQVFERLAPSIWVVRTFDAQQKQIGQGSAVVVAKSRLITNCHVLARAKSFKVAQDKKVYDAKLEYPDVERDLCWIHVPDLQAPVVTFGDATSLKVGQKVYAIGSPRGLELTMSDGIISALRDVRDGSPLIQMTAAVSKGSSGGGLFDTDARLIGITTFQRTDGQNLNFAHSSAWINEVPERGKAALAKRAEKKESDERGQEGEKSLYPRQVEADEFAAHFRDAKSVDAVTGTGSKVTLTLKPDGDIEILNRESRKWSPGTRTLQPGQNRICFNFTNAAFRVANDCYQLYQTGPISYSLRSVTDSYFISYDTATR